MFLTDPSKDLNIQNTHGVSATANQQWPGNLCEQQDIVGKTHESSVRAPIEPADIRLVHRAEVGAIEGGSYRAKEAREHAEQRTQT